MSEELFKKMAQSVIDGESEEAEDLAKEADLDPEFAKKFLNFIIAEVIQHHKSHLS